MTIINSESNNNSMNDGCGCLFIFLLMLIGVFSIPFLQFLLVFSNRKMTLESERYVSAMNQGQQAYFQDKSTFSSYIIGMKTGKENYIETTNFKYSVSTNKQAVFNYGVSKNDKHKSHVGGVFVLGVKSNNNQDKIKTETIICVADEPGTITPIPPTIKNGKVACGSGTKAVKPGGC